VVVKLTTVQVTKLPLFHKILKIGMMCFAKTGLTEKLYIVQKEEFFNNMLYALQVHLRKGQAYSQETNPSSRQKGCYIKTIRPGVQLKKYLWSWVARGLAPRRTYWS
jgi:hypothetical protein